MLVFKSSKTFEVKKIEKSKSIEIFLNKYSPIVRDIFCLSSKLNIRILFITFALNILFI